MIIFYIQHIFTPRFTYIFNQIKQKMNSINNYQIMKMLIMTEA